MNNYVPVKVEPKPNGKLDKIPVNAQGYAVSAMDPNNWMSREDALKIMPHVGIAMDGTVKLACIDFDDALVDGLWSPLVAQFYETLRGCYFESSVSGTGCHMWFTYTGEFPEHKCKNTSLNIELYHEKRFIVQGDYVAGDMSWDGTHTVAGIISAFFSPITASEAEWRDTPTPEWNGPVDDDVLLEKAFKAKSAKQSFGGGVSFAELYEANEQALGSRWPSEGRQYDASSADASFAASLAFWTGKDCQRMERLMLRSRLNREKWINHKSYLRMTILNACKLTKDVYSSQPATTEDVKAGPEIGVLEPSLREGVQFLTAQQQLDYFKDCIYVTGQNRVLTPLCEMLKSDQFNGLYGGYEFSMDGDSKTEKKPFTVLTESRCVKFPKAHRTVFRPDLPFQAMTVDKGTIGVNVYKACGVEPNNGDVTPFLTHLNKLLPDERDREILTSWMATIVQCKGKKLFWAPVIQGCEGNGKTFFSFLMQAILGDKYVHLPNADDLANVFNAWMRNKLMICVEDVCVGAKVEMMESLKPMITSETICIQAKGQDQVTEKVCANFILNSNYRDGVIKTQNDRRYAMFFTAQQNAEDITRDGMGGNYFTNLYDWARKDGYGAIHNYLINYIIKDEFHPLKLATRAPQTSSTMDAVAVSMSPIAQDINEAVESGMLGFCGGWISLKAVQKLTERRRITPQKLTQIITDLGYEYPECLKNGRTNNPTVTDSVKTKLFLRTGDVRQNITSPSEVVKKYDSDQVPSQFAASVASQG